MGDDRQRIEIRSYRAVFELQRRIYRVDRLRLNPSGIPLRGIAYALVAFVCVALAAQLPLAAPALGVLPWHLRHLAVPVGLAVLATMVQVDGRALHVAAGALLRHLRGPRRVCRFQPHREPQRWMPVELTLIADGSGPVFRRMRFTGPGAVMVRSPHIRATGRRRPAVVTLTQRPGEPSARGHVLVLRDGGRLEVRPGEGVGR